MKKILFLCPYPPNQAPSQRFRYEQYLAQLSKNGFGVEIQPFFSPKAYAALFQSGNLLSKIHAIIHSYLKRYSLFLHASSFDFIFVHRESSPVGPPIVEWILARIMGKKIIYDFDDAIWLTDKSNESFLAGLLRWRSKVASVCRWSYKVSCGNSYLADYAKQFNRNVCIIPTTIQTVNPALPSAQIKDAGEKLTIGWTGSNSTVKYLRSLVPVLALLERKHDSVRFVIIADENPNLPLKNVEFRNWNAATEITDLDLIDIGIMPLPDDPWTRGKCGLKALQYMAMGIPAVVSPVGVNSEIVRHGIDGFLCDTETDWITHLEILIGNAGLRKDMGISGRQRVVDCYSVSSNASDFLSLFQ